MVIKNIIANLKYAQLCPIIRDSSVRKSPTSALQEQTRAMTRCAKLCRISIAKERIELNKHCGEADKFELAKERIELNKHCGEADKFELAKERISEGCISKSRMIYSFFVVKRCNLISAFEPIRATAR